MLYAPLPAPIRKIVKIYLLSRLAKGDKNYEIIADVKSWFGNRLEVIIQTLWSASFISNILKKS